MCREDERTHKHHIIPRYRGGSDAVENLIEVTITQHAMYHYCNYQLWKSEEDKIAWRMLSGQITIQEAKLEAMRLGCKKSGELTKLKLQDPEENKKHRKKCKEAYQNSPNRDRMISNIRQNQPKAMEAAKRPESKEKRKQTFKEIKHQQGERNSQYGKMWITDGTKEGSYRINKGEPIPEGFYKGRVCRDQENLTYFYYIIDPKENLIITKNLTAFCLRNNLSYQEMYNSVIRNKPTRKGYVITRKCIREKDFPTTP